MRSKRTLNPWAKAMASPSFRCGSIDVVGGVVDRHHPQAGRLGLGCRGRALAQADHHVDPRLLEVQRVGVSLRAVPDDGDLATADDRTVRVGLVVDGDGHLSLPFRWWEWG
jgi:hypothetical protein